MRCSSSCRHRSTAPHCSHRCAPAVSGCASQRNGRNSSAKPIDLQVCDDRCTRANSWSHDEPRLSRTAAAAHDSNNRTRARTAPDRRCPPAASNCVWSPPVSTGMCVCCPTVDHHTAACSQTPTRRHAPRLPRGIFSRLLAVASARPSYIRLFAFGRIRLVCLCGSALVDARNLLSWRAVLTPARCIPCGEDAPGRAACVVHKRCRRAVCPSPRARV